MSSRQTTEICISNALQADGKLKHLKLIGNQRQYVISVKVFVLSQLQGSGSLSENVH